MLKLWFVAVAKNGGTKIDSSCENFDNCVVWCQLQRTRTNMFNLFC